MLGNQRELSPRSLLVLSVHISAIQTVVCQRILRRDHCSPSNLVHCSCLAVWTSHFCVHNRGKEEEGPCLQPPRVDQHWSMRTFTLQIRTSTATSAIKVLQNLLVAPPKKHSAFKMWKIKLEYQITQFYPVATSVLCLLLSAWKLFCSKEDKARLSLSHQDKNTLNASDRKALPLKH